ncbi:MAG: hypothetical protein U0401_16040 [Anaerolineae bacterium]
MTIYPDDRVLVAVMNNEADWRRVQDEHWYRLPVKHAPEGTPHFDWLAFTLLKPSAATNGPSITTPTSRARTADPARAYPHRS